MMLVAFGSALLGAAVVAAWWGRRATPTKRWAVALAAVIALLGVGGVGVYVWARTATDSSQFARALVWGESAYGDQDRFPSRRIPAGGEPVVFEQVADSPVAAYRDASGRPLAELLERADTTAFIVLHGDRVLYEDYFNGSGPSAAQTSFSVAKSFVATLVGIAIAEGAVGGLDDPLTEYVPELLERDVRFGDITIRHLVTMSSGLSFDDGSSPWADPANTYHGTDLRDAAVTTPRVIEEPGTTFDYNDWNVILLGMVIERATGTSVSDYTAERLWAPMGAEADGSWSLDSEEHGFEKSFVGLNGRAVDLAKLGRLYLNDGRSGGRQVVPADFVAEATRRDVATDPAAEYQYLWWVDVERDSYFANGDHGQFIYVDPSAELVMVRHGSGPGDIAWIDFFGELSDWLAPRLG